MASVLFDSDEEKNNNNNNNDPDKPKPSVKPAGKARPKFKAPAPSAAQPSVFDPAAGTEGTAADAANGDTSSAPPATATASDENAGAGAAPINGALLQLMQQQPDVSVGGGYDQFQQNNEELGARPATTETANQPPMEQQQQPQYSHQAQRPPPPPQEQLPFTLPPLPNAAAMMARGRAPAAQWSNDTAEASTLFRPQRLPQQALPRAEFMSSPVLANQAQRITMHHAAPVQFATVNVQPPPPPPVPAPIVVAPDPPTTLTMPAPVQMPVSEISPRHVLAAQNAEGTAGLPSWEAFEELRRTLDDSHARLLSIHSEIAKSQISREDEAAAFRAAAEEQLSRQRKEIETLSDKYNEAAANLDHMQGVLRRKTEEVMHLEQRLHDAAVQRAATIQHAAHIDDKAKLAEKAKLAAEVRARELELSLEHATKLLTSLRKQLNSANEDKTEALQKQYKLFEENRQQLIHFYAERETFVLAAFNDSIARSHAQLVERERAREQQVVAHWQNVSHAQLAELKSLVDENKTRADGHAREVATMKEKQEDDKNRWLLHLQNEIKLADERAAERQRLLVADLTKREREMSEREQKMRVQFAQAEQDAKMQLIQREAELKSTYDKLLEDLRKAYDGDRDKTVTGFREQLASIAASHIANERELEKMHREKEKEMAQRYRIAGYDADDQRQRSELDNVTTKTTGTLLAKFEQYEVREKERAETTRSRLLTGGIPGVSAPATVPAPVPTLAATAEKVGPRKTQFSHISGFSSTTAAPVADSTSPLSSVPPPPPPPLTDSTEQKQ